MFKIQSLDHVAITVSDMARSIEWYGRVLGLEKTSRWEGDPQFMSAGDAAVALFSASGSGMAMTEADKEERLTMRHFGFKVDRAGFEAAQEDLRGQGIDFRFDDHGVCHSIYLSDPDGHTIEITTYEL